MATSPVYNNPLPLAAGEIPAAPPPLTGPPAVNPVPSTPVTIPPWQPYPTTP